MPWKDYCQGLTSSPWSSGTSDMMLYEWRLSNSRDRLVSQRCVTQAKAAEDNGKRELVCCFRRSSACLQQLRVSTRGEGVSREADQSGGSKGLPDKSMSHTSRRSLAAQKATSLAWRDATLGCVEEDHACFASTTSGRWSDHISLAKDWGLTGHRGASPWKGKGLHAFD
jgi:hypothetical protein